MSIEGYNNVITVCSGLWLDCPSPNISIKFDIPFRRALKDESLTNMSNNSGSQCPIEAGTSGNRVVRVKIPLVKTTTSVSPCDGH